MDKTRPPSIRTPSRTPTLKRHNSSRTSPKRTTPKSPTKLTRTSPKSARITRETARRILLATLPPEETECEKFIRNPFSKDNWIELKDHCEDPVINWEKVYKHPASKTKKEICRDFYFNPTKIPSIRDIPDDKRLYLPDLGSLNNRLKLWCSDPSHSYHENLFKHKFKHTSINRTTDLPFIYSKFYPVSKSEFKAPLVMSGEVISEILGGNALIKLILLKYLQRKHSNACIVIGNPDSIHFNFDIRIIPNSEIDKIRERYISLGSNPDEHTIIIGHTADTSKLYTAHRIHSTNSLRKTYENCKHRYILGLLEIINDVNPTNTHNNAYIIDKKTNRLYLYEPHGTIMYWEPLLVKYLHKHLLTTLETDFTIIPFGGTCDARGLQLLEEEEHEPVFETLIKDPEGYCSYYSAWILDMVLENPGILPYNIPRYAIRSIHRLKEFIRGFGVFINAIAIDYLTILQRNFKPSERTQSIRDNLMESLIDFYLDIEEEY